MPVFDFNEKKEEAVKAQRSYKLVYSSERTTSTQHPIMILDDSGSKLVHHSNGMFEAPTVGSAFIYDTDEKSSHNILEIDARFENLLKWLGENHIMVRLSGQTTERGYAVYKILETGVAVRGSKLSGENGFLQFMIDRLLQSDAPSEEVVDPDEIDDNVSGTTRCFSLARKTRETPSMARTSSGRICA